MNRTQILEMPASDLIGRLVLNPNGAEFVVTALTFDARSGQVIIEIDDIDETPDGPPDTPAGSTRWKTGRWRTGFDESVRHRSVVVPESHQPASEGPRSPAR